MAKRTWQQKLLGPVMESDLQSAVEKYLKLKRIKFLHLPDILMLALSPKCRYLPKHWRIQISVYIQDWPDLLIPRSVLWMPYPLLLGLELKTKTGTFTDGQKNIAPIIRMRSARNLDDAIMEVDSFLNWNPSQPTLAALGEFNTIPLQKAKKTASKLANA